mgnify:CR=1 FL=1
MNRKIKKGGRIWDRIYAFESTLVGATVLVAGAGHVGSAFAQLCKALGAKRTIG